MSPSALLAAAALALAAGAAVAAAGAAGAPAGDGPGARGPEPAGTRPGERVLLVTFADAPRRPGAERRVGPLGPVAPVLPEEGVWALRPAHPAGARGRVLARPRVSGAEWSLARRTAVVPRPPGPAPLGPAPAVGDPLLAMQWGLARPGTTWGADLTATGPRPRIAVLDGGVDGSHEEWRSPGLLAAGRSTLRGDGDHSDHGATGHGTHVAGIAAAPVNGVGVVGVAPARAGDAQVVPVQTADRQGRSTDATIIRGIRHAVRSGATVINISAGGPGYSRALDRTVLWATRRGALIVASVGNDGGGPGTLSYPAAHSRVLGVGARCGGAVGPDCPVPYGVASFSSRNRSVDLVAPGVGVVSSVPARVRHRAVAPGYAVRDGTSMAAPHVAGVAALVQAANGGTLSPHQLRRHLLNTATDIPPRGRDGASGHGAVNPRAAVTLRAPADDVDEVNDDVGWVSGWKRPQARSPLVVRAAADRLRDPRDVYAVTLRRGERLRVTLTHRRGALDLSLWRPGTRTVTARGAAARRDRIDHRGRRGSRPKAIVHRATRTGRHYVEVAARGGATRYRLAMRRG